MVEFFNSIVNIGWERPFTPGTDDGKKKKVDSVEAEIRGIEALDRNKEDDGEFIMCFVHFTAGTDELDGIFFSVWNEDGTIDDPISSDVITEEEKKVIVDFALSELWKTGDD